MIMINFGCFLFIAHHNGMSSIFDQIFDFTNYFISLKVANSRRIPTELLSGYKFAVKLSTGGENRAANVPTGHKKFRICIFES